MNYRKYQTLLMMPLIAGNEVIGIRHMSYFGLSYDHRVVDGAMAAFFLNKVKEVIENYPDDAI